MLRSTRRLCVLEGIRYQPQAICSLPVLAQDISPEAFHSNCFAGLYEYPTENFGQCHKLFNRRIITALPCTFAKKTLLVPFLVDTGAPQTYLHTIALNKFTKEENRVGNAWDMHVHQTLLKVTENSTSDGKHVLSHLNVLGMDFLEEVTSDLLKYLAIILRSCST